MKRRESPLDEQIAKIEAKRKTTAFQRWFPLALVSALLGAAVYVGWLHREALLGEGGTIETVAAHGRRLSKTPPREVLKSLRERVAGIQEEWESLAKSGEIQSRLKSLRRDVREQRDALGKSAGKQWKQLVEKSDELVELAREKKKELPGQLADLGKILRVLEETTDAEEDGDSEGEAEDEDPADEEQETEQPVYDTGR